MPGVPLALADVSALFLLAGFDVLGLAQAENQYWPNHPDFDEVRKSSPWWRVATTQGTVTIGWRNRVLCINWDDIGAVGAEKVTTDDVTKYDYTLHAWGLPAALAYLTELRHLLPRAESHHPNVAQPQPSSDMSKIPPKSDTSRERVNSSDTFPVSSGAGEVLTEAIAEFFGSMSVSLEPDDEFGQFPLPAVEKFSLYLESIATQAAQHLTSAPERGILEILSKAWEAESIVLFANDTNGKGVWLDAESKAEYITLQRCARELRAALAGAEGQGEG